MIKNNYKRLVKKLAIIASTLFRHCERSAAIYTFITFLLSLSFSGAYAQGLLEVDNSRFSNKATIQVLNKTNAKTEILEIDVNKKTTVGSLNLIIHKCWQAPLEQRPESKMLIEIFQADLAQKSKEKRIFYGWMFASSPSISNLEHPIYDITAINCKK